MYVASIALVALFQGSVTVTPVETAARNHSIVSSYEDAYHRAGQEGKPIFVLFTAQKQPAELQKLQTQGLLNDYLVVVADKNTDAGRRAFAMFNITGDEGVSVIERNRQWQFARYERKLNGEELAKVATACRNASGYPTTDPLVTASAYVQPATNGAVLQGVNGQVLPQANYVLPGGQAVQPTMQYYQQPQMQFYPSMGGGCASGNCGGGVIYSGGCASGNCGR